MVQQTKGRRASWPGDEQHVADGAIAHNAVYHPSPTRRSMIALGLSLGLAPGWSRAQNPLSKPIRLIVPVAPGGSNDFGARVIAPHLAEALGTTIIVENKPGASSTLGADYVAKSTPDGLTLLFCSANAVAVAPQTFAKPPFNFPTDLTSINMVGQTASSIAVHPGLGVKNLAELIALSKTREVSLGSSGELTRLIIESLIQDSGAKILHVPYKGGGPAIADALGGHISGVVQDVPTFIPLHQDGKLIIITVASEKRLGFLPNVQTVNETIPGFSVTNFLGLFAPAKTPRPIIDRINAGIQKVVAREDVRAQFIKAAVEPGTMASPEVFHQHVLEHYRRWGKLLREKNLITN